MADPTIMALEHPAKPAKGSKKVAANSEQRERIFDAFRRWGYYEATLDPLGVFQPQKLADLELTGGAAEEARRLYCGNVGVEFMHLPEPERRRWIAERIEGPELEVDQEKILERLVRADLFEQVLQARYLGTKRFSLEGVTSLIPLLDSILDTAGDFGAVDCVMAMSHRGRLNVMVHAACKPPHEVVSGFEDVDPRSVLGAGDVKSAHVRGTDQPGVPPEDRIRPDARSEPLKRVERRLGGDGHGHRVHVDERQLAHCPDLLALRRPAPRRRALFAFQNRVSCLPLNCDR